MSTTAPRPAWDTQAACRNTDPEVFFPVGSASPKPAQRICRTCPVAADCLNHALQHGHDDGIWGGLTSEQRRRIHQRRRLQGGGRR